jgi:predicted CoA-substrate-specific enzyme activase
VITAGLDIGSLFTKAVVMDGDDIVASRVIATTGNVSGEVGPLVSETLRDAGNARDRVDCLGVTGHGADLIDKSFADFTEDILACVAAAAAFYLPEVRTLIDMGGQSTTSVSLNPDGEVTNFMRNDRCAAGSGRLLEVMAEKLGIGVGEIDAAVARSGRTVEVSNQCGVFAESEVITHVNNGESADEVMAGICSSVAKMASAQGRRFGVTGVYTLTGGVARFDSVNSIVRERLGGDYQRFPGDPKLAAAIGAALLGDPG